MAEPDAKAYRLALEEVIRLRPELFYQQSNCAHCGIRFLCDPRNAKRSDLGCPFGCSEEHRKRTSQDRAKKYYSTESGKAKKKAHNDLAYRKRSRENLNAKRGNGPPVDSTDWEPSLEIPFPENRDLPMPLLNADDSFWVYLRWLIQSFGVADSSLSEVKSHVLKIFRQRSMGFSSRGRYMAHQNHDQRNKGDPE